MGIWLPRPIPIPKTTWEPIYQALDELTSRVWSRAAPVVDNNPLANWYGCRRRVWLTRKPLNVDPKAKKAMKGKLLTPLLIADWSWIDWK